MLALGYYCSKLHSRNNKYMLIKGNCLEEMKKMEDNSVDAIVTDPPYGLSFMGKKWDYDVPSQEIWEECLRVLKPGGGIRIEVGHYFVSNWWLGERLNRRLPAEGLVPAMYTAQFQAVREMRNLFRDTTIVTAWKDGRA